MPRSHPQLCAVPTIKRSASCAANSPSPRSAVRSFRTRSAGWPAKCSRPASRTDTAPATKRPGPAPTPTSAKPATTSSPAPNTPPRSPRNGTTSAHCSPTPKPAAGKAKPTATNASPQPPTPTPQDSTHNHPDRPVDPTTESRLNERLNTEIRRRTDVVGIFPDRAAVPPLVGAVLAEQHDERIEGRRYLSLDVLARARTQTVAADPTPASTEPPELGPAASP